MRRRALSMAVTAGLVSPAVGLRAQAGAPSLRRVGVLAPSTHAKEEVTLKPFFDEMARLGWTEGRTVAYDRMYADDHHGRLPQLAQALAARGPELIYAPPQPAAVAARRATSTIPIVFATGTDPVGAGLVQSLSRPGGNVTGLGMFGSLAPKVLELLREIAPQVRRIGLIGDGEDPRFALDRGALEAMLPRFGMSVLARPAHDPASLDAAVRQLLDARVEVIFTCSGITYNLRQRLVTLTRPGRVAVLGHRFEMADDGALLVYGPSLPEQIRRSALLVDKVLRGAKPADIPVEQLSVLQLVVNLQAAKALGLTIPRTVMLRADRVIE